MYKLIGTSLWYQMCWFIAVLGKERWQWILCMLVAATLFHMLARQTFSVWRLLSLLSMGIATDSINIAIHIFEFSTPWLPIWLIALWGVFIWYVQQLLPYLLRLRRQWLLLFGGLGGMLSYWAGASLNAVTFGLPIGLTLVFLFSEWVLITKVFMEILCYAKPTSSTRDN